MVISQEALDLLVTLVGWVCGFVGAGVGVGIMAGLAREAVNHD